MRYILVNNHRVVRTVEEYFSQAIRHLWFRGYTARECVKPPAKRTRQRWKQTGKAKAICGCWISSQRGERCNTHNAMSWLSFTPSV